MEVKTGYLYHIKDSFFDIVNDDKLMTNHERGKKRPTYFTIKDGEILWFIPISSKVGKYKKIIDDKIRKRGFCDTILIRKVLNEDCAILLQNAFPTLEKYIDHVHTANCVPAKVGSILKDEILSKFNNLLKLHDRGIDLFFPDIDKIKKMMFEELSKDKELIGV